MAARILQTRSGRDVVFLVDSANASFAVANASVNAANESVTGLSIRTIIAGVGIGGEVIIQRGGNTVFRTAFSGSFDFAGMGQAITANSAATLDISFTGANCSAQVCCSKQSNAVNSTY